MGWPNSVDDNTIFVEGMCNNHVVFMDQKRKMIHGKEDDCRSTTKKDNMIKSILKETRAASMNAEEVSQHTLMDVENFAKYGKEGIVPTNKQRLISRKLKV